MDVSQFSAHVKQLALSCPNSIPELFDFIEENLELELVLIHSRKEWIKYLRQSYDQQQDEIRYLKTLNDFKDQKIQELEYLENPYSMDGEAICNSKLA